MTALQEGRRHGGAALRAGNALWRRQVKMHVKSPFEAQLQRGYLGEPYQSAEDAIWRRRIGVEPTADGKACHRF